MSRPHALVTGASAGLGREFARLFAADGWNVILVARRKERLEELAAKLVAAHSIDAVVIAADLSDPASPRQVHTQVVAAGRRVDVLVNNAGFGTNGAFAELDPAREMAMVQVNVAALVELTRLFLPNMIERGHGHVLNVGSTAGFQPGPFMATYCASKAFVNSFTEALAEELRGTGVSATVSCPGATATEFSKISGNDTAALFQNGVVASAAEVARHAYVAMKYRRAVAVPGLMNKVAMQALRLTPRAVARRVAAGIIRGKP